MSQDSHNTKRWRLVFIIAESLVTGWVAVNQFDPRSSIREYPLNPDLPMLVIAYASLAAVLFLLVVSPFFFRRLGLVAWIGWSIALAFLLFT
jgi:hypothetical protein